MSNEKDTKRKKTMYVPDEEVLNYNKSAKLGKEDLSHNMASLDIEDVGSPISDKASKQKLSTQNIGKDEIIEEKEKTEKKRFIKTLFSFFIFKGITKKLLVIKIVTIIAALALIGSSIYLGMYFGDLSVQDGKIENVRNNYELNRDDYTKNEDNQFSKFDYLKTLNSDIVGWISIDNTEVNNPVYQTYDNQYYVTHDMEKKSNSYGALFLDYRCNIDPKALTQNQIIYGHNMRYGAMFGTLDEYRKIEFAKQNTIIKFDSLYEQRAYKIFAIMIVNDSEDETFGYSYTAYRSEFTGDTDFLTWVDRSKQRSLYDFPVDVNAQDEVITLSTCCYDYTNARFVVLARLVREGEEATVDPSGVVKNADVIYSKEYYTKKKLPIPTVSSSEATTSNANSKTDASK